MFSPFLVGRPAGGNDADESIRDLDMHDEQQAPGGIEADDGIARLVVALRFHHSKERVEEHGCRLLEANPVMLAGIGRRLLCVPYESRAVSS